MASQNGRKTKVVRVRKRCSSRSEKDLKVALELSERDWRENTV